MNFQFKAIHHIFIALFITVMLCACGKKAEVQQAAMQAMPVGVVTVEPTIVPISAEAVAQTEGAKAVEIRPRVGGILLKKLFEEGAPIKAGQPMFLIDPVPYQIALASAKAQLSQQRARIEQTQRESDRLKGLLVSDAISQREADNAAADNAVAKAILLQGEAMVHEAELNLSYTTVKAPSNGIAGRFLYSEGALVAPNSSLLTTIVQISPIWVRFSLSDSELAPLGGRLTDKNVKKVTLILADGSEYNHTGKLNFAASEIDPLIGTQQLRATFENPDHQLLPGQFVRARITTGNRDGVFLIPQTSVLTGDQGKFVFVADTDKNGKTVAAVRPIQEGGWQGSNWVILGGLKVGDKVIADNLIKVRPGAPIAPHPFGSSPATQTANKAVVK